jgi:hypothetical protein
MFTLPDRSLHFIKDISLLNRRGDAGGSPCRDSHTSYTGRRGYCTGYFFVFCALCLITTPARATQADFEKRMARGVTAIDARDFIAAQEEFRAALTEHPDDPEATLSLAIALTRATDPRAESALKAALRLDPGNPRTNLELGTYYYSRAMYDEAGDYFDAVLTQHPDQEMKAAAEEYRAAILKQSGSGKRWGISATAGLQHDSNVPLVASGGELPLGISRRSDLRSVLALNLTGVILRDSSQELSGGYSLYQTLHLHLSDFNLTQNRIDLTYKRQVHPLLSARLGGSFESILMGGTQYLSDFAITPGLFATFREGMTTGVEYRFRDSFFKNSDTFPGNTDRNGTTHSLILSHRQQLNESLTLRLGYTLERENTTVAAWSATSHHGSAGLAVTLPYALLCDMTLDADTRKYAESIDGATAVRSDNSISGGASLTWQAGEHLGASFGYHYSSNNSNISGYDYNRGITSIMVQGRY